MKMKLSTLWLKILGNLIFSYSCEWCATAPLTSNHLYFCMIIMCLCCILTFDIVHLSLKHHYNNVKRKDATQAHNYHTKIKMITG